MSVFMPIPSCFYYCSFIIELDVSDANASGSSFIVQDCFGSPVVCLFVCFSHEVEHCSLEVCEELCWDFDEECTESVDCFWKDCHFYYVNPTNPRVWKIFSFYDIFFDFFFQ